MIHRRAFSSSKKVATSTTLVASSSIVTAIANDVWLLTGRIGTSWNGWFCRHCQSSFPQFYHSHQESLPIIEDGIFPHSPRLIIPLAPHCIPIACRGVLSKRSGVFIVDGTFHAKRFYRHILAKQVLWAPKVWSSHLCTRGHTRYLCYRPPLVHKGLCEMWSCLASTTRRRTPIVRWGGYS